MLTAVEKLIVDIPVTASVLDIGYGGLDGENTTLFLRAHFDKVEGISKDANGVARFWGLHEEARGDTVNYGFYPNDMPEKKWDLLVHDTNIEGNLAFWSKGGQEKAWSYVKDGGGIITYIMLTDAYGEEETQRNIKEHRESYWASCLPHIVWKHVVAMQREERRDYIMWVLLRKNV